MGFVCHSRAKAIRRDTQRLSFRSYQPTEALFSLSQPPAGAPPSRPSGSATSCNSISPQRVDPISALPLMRRGRPQSASLLQLLSLVAGQSLTPSTAHTWVRVQPVRRLQVVAYQRGPMPLSLSRRVRSSRGLASFTVNARPLKSLPLNA